jgi:hypothetical protein
VSKRHVREAVTPVDSTTYGPGGALLADCSCGGTYSVPQGWNEGEALDEAHETHVAECAAIEALQRLAKRWPQTLTLVSMDGALHVIHTGDERYGLSFGPDRQQAIIADIDGIPNDGGAW